MSISKLIEYAPTFFLCRCLPRFTTNKGENISTIKTVASKCYGLVILVLILIHHINIKKSMILCLDWFRLDLLKSSQSIMAIKLLPFQYYKHSKFSRQASLAGKMVCWPGMAQRFDSSQVCTLSPGCDIMAHDVTGHLEVTICLWSIRCASMMTSSGNPDVTSPYRSPCCWAAALNATTAVPVPS